jgi:hypothetical protein
MLKFAGSLSHDYEYAVIWWGQSNAQPQGLASEGITEAYHLAQHLPGQDITISSWSSNTGTGATLVTDETYAYGYYVGAELRLIQTVYGSASNAEVRVGRARVTACGSNLLVVDWLTAAAAFPSSSSTVTFTASSTVNWGAAHTLQAGDRVVFTGTVPTGITAGTTYYVVTSSTPSLQVSLTRGGTPVTFSTSGTNANGAVKIGGYVNAVDKWRSYANVRVLTPYQPETPGDYPTTTGPFMPYPSTSYVVPEEVTSYEDVGVFLPFTFTEGVEGYGYSGSSGTESSLVLTVGAIGMTVNILAGGYVQVRNSACNCLGYIVSNDATTITVSSWTSTPTGTLEWEAHVPHYRDNPYHALPGDGFRYPSNWSQPAPTSLAGQVYNRPRARFTSGYHSITDGAPVPYFGAMVEFAWQLSQKLGRRVNIIHLAVPASSIVRNEANTQEPWNEIGWFDKSIHLDWTPSATDGLAGRLERLVTTIAPAALEGELSTKTLKVLGIVGFQGEADTSTAPRRELYATAMPSFYDWLRGKIVDAGLSPYGDNVKVPVVHASLPSYPWEEATVPVVLTEGDTEGLVNAAIAKRAALDGFYATFDTNDSPQQTLDIFHFDGEGEVINGGLAADGLGELIDLALSMSEDLSEVKVCNLALSYLGESPITSLDPAVDSSLTAALCARFYPTTRDDLLGRRAWSFATKRKTLVAVETEWTQWDYAYGVPADCLRPDAVQVAGADSDYAVPGAAAYPVTVDVQIAPTQLPRIEFQIEQDSEGNRILYTDQEDAVLRYTAKVCDVSAFPAWFTKSLAWLLAADLAGALIKGDKGSEQAMRCTQMAEAILAKAGDPEGAQRLNRLVHNPRSITGR